MWYHSYIKRDRMRKKLGDLLQGKKLAVCIGILAGLSLLWMGLADRFDSSISRVSAAVFDSGIFPSTSGLNLGNASQPWNDLIVNGKIGIDNTAPTYDVDITGGLRVTGTSTFSSYLGVGTTAPTTLMHLKRSANDAYTALFVENGSTGSSATPRIVIGENMATSGISFFYSGSGGAGTNLSNTSSTGIIQTLANAVNGINIIAGGSDASIRFAAGGQANSDLGLAIDSSGRVGIGTSTPASAFHVLTTTSTFGNSWGYTGQVQLAGMAASPVSGRLIFGTDGTGWQFRIGKNQSGAITDIVTFTDAGYVGIGTSTPSQMLYASGSIGVVSWLGAGCETGCEVSGGYVLLYDTSVLDAYTSSGSAANRMYFDTNYLGIGVVPTGVGKTQVVQGTASYWAGSFQNIANNVNAWGVHVATGPTTGSTLTSGSYRLVTLNDGDGTDIGNIMYGTASGAGVITYNAFTGSHISRYVGNIDDLGPGDLLVLTGDYSPRYVDSPTGEPVYEVALSDKVNDKRVFGVYSTRMESTKDDTLKDMIYVYALGNAFMKVTDTNGDIETGDWITTSPRPRFGQRQGDKVNRNYSIAKAQVSVDWSEEKVDPKLGFRWKMIPVSLHAQ
jgi:hypothetical protein